MDYSKSEKAEIIKYIEENYGTIDCFYEFDDFKIKVARINPSIENPYYTFVTIGMGEHKMTRQNDDDSSSYAELILSISPDWDIKDESYSWALDELLFLVDLPVWYYSYYDYGYIQNNFDPYSKHTDFTAMAFLHPKNMKENQAFLETEKRKIQFFQLVPLYKEECEFALKNSIEELLKNDKKGEINFVLDLNRKNTVSLTNDEKNRLDDIIDDALWHIGDYYAKGIDIPEINIYNHMALFLLWSFENKILDTKFINENIDVIDKFVSRDYEFIREFVKYNLDGVLRKEFFSKNALGFINYYYDNKYQSNEHFYPMDIDRYAMDVFGQDRYYSDEFKREAYLFVNYGEKYYSDIKNDIDRNYRNYKKIENIVNQFSDI